MKESSKKILIGVGVTGAVIGGILLAKAAAKAEPTVFHCPYCGESFATEAALAAHIASAHPEPITYQCPYCGQIFLSQAELDAHIASAHPEEPPIIWTCPYCDTTFNSLAELLNHIATAHPEQPEVFICPYCGQSFASQEELNTHIASAHPEVTLYTCPYCGQTFTTQQALSAHIATAHPQPPTPIDDSVENYSWDNGLLKVKDMRVDDIPSDKQALLIWQNPFIFADLEYKYPPIMIGSYEIHRGFHALIAIGKAQPDGSMLGLTGESTTLTGGDLGILVYGTHAIWTTTPMDNFKIQRLITFGTYERWDESVGYYETLILGVRPKIYDLGVYILEDLKYYPRTTAGVRDFLKKQVPGRRIEPSGMKGLAAYFIKTNAIKVSKGWELTNLTLDPDFWTGTEFPKHGYTYTVRNITGQRRPETGGVGSWGTMYIGRMSSVKPDSGPYFVTNDGRYFIPNYHKDTITFYDCFRLSDYPYTENKYLEPYASATYHDFYNPTWGALKRYAGQTNDIWGYDPNEFYMPDAVTYPPYQ